MRAIVTAISLAVGVSLAPISHAQDAEPRPQAEVMVLGTFHFTGGGQDMINPEVDDFLAPTRQAEIAEILDRLEAFAPTRIAVELTPEHEAAFNARYGEFVAGERELGVNERQQIGMRLAARLGHDRLYAVDSPGGMNFDAMMSAAAAADQSALMAEWESYIGDVQAYLAKTESLDRSILERMISQNSDDLREMHNLYLILAQMGGADNPAGAREMTNWWGRNLQIFANIARIAEPGERVLVVYGAGHKALLDDYFQGAPNITWVESLDYLLESPAPATE